MVSPYGVVLYPQSFLRTVNEKHALHSIIGRNCVPWPKLRPQDLSSTGQYCAHSTVVLTYTVPRNSRSECRFLQYCTLTVTVHDVRYRIPKQTCISCRTVQYCLNTYSWTGLYCVQDGTSPAWQAGRLPDDRKVVTVLYRIYYYCTHTHSQHNSARRRTSTQSRSSSNLAETLQKTEPDKTLFTTEQQGRGRK